MFCYKEVWKCNCYHGILCMTHVIYRRGMIHWNQYCGSSFIPCINRKTFCIARKGEKQIQILDGY
jgi:hypothetical protein